MSDIPEIDEHFKTLHEGNTESQLYKKSFVRLMAEILPSLEKVKESVFSNGFFAVIKTEDASFVALLVSRNAITQETDWRDRYDYYSISAVSGPAVRVTTRLKAIDTLANKPMMFVTRESIKAEATRFVKSSFAD